MADNKKSSTTAKKLSNKEIREARRKAKLKEEKIPAGMKAEDYADAAFRKKVTIIMGSILLVFIIGVVAVILGAKLKTDNHNKEFERIENEFLADSQEIKQRLADIEANGGKLEDKAVVEINVTDENYSYWIQALDASYQLEESDPDYGCYRGATINLRGQFVTRVFTGNNVNYWLYRTHDDHEHAHDHEETTAPVSGEETTESKDTKIPLEDLGDPIEIFFADKNAEIPADGDWVQVKGIVGIDSYKSLSAVHDAVVTEIEAPEHEHE